MSYLVVGLPNSHSPFLPSTSKLDIGDKILYPIVYSHWDVFKVALYPRKNPKIGFFHYIWDSIHQEE